MLHCFRCHCILLHCFRCHCILLHCFRCHCISEESNNYVVLYGLFML